MEVAAELVPALITDFDEGFVADLARVLRSSGVAATWKDEGFSAKDLAENLRATAEGLKHHVKTLAEYRERMQVAVRMVCSRLNT
jgi:hypothetical protein